jgi:predicted RNA-binding Zn ribbon-like protein
MATAVPHPEQANPAPGELETVRRFVNTLDLEQHEPEQLDSPAALAGWLTEHGLTSRRVTARPSDLRRAHEVRQALRNLLLANNGFSLDENALDVLNRAAARARLTAAFDDHVSWRMRPAAAGIDEGIGELLAIVFRAMSDGTWERLKACGEESCQWAFYDRSKNRSGRWCTMAECGNRAKARAYRERARATRRR